MKIFTYIIAMLALLSGAAWSWDALVAQVPAAKIASLLPAITYDASTKTEAPAAETQQYAKFVRLDSQAGPSPIYPASPAKELLGTFPALPRVVVARQKAMAQLAARGALTAMAKASPHETTPARVATRTRVAANQAVPNQAAANRVSRSYQSGQPLQLHPQERLPRTSDTLTSSAGYRRDNGPQVMGYAEERRPNFLEALLN